MCVCMYVCVYVSIYVCCMDVVHILGCNWIEVDISIPYFDETLWLMECILLLVGVSGLRKLMEIALSIVYWYELHLITSSLI